MYGLRTIKGLRWGATRVTIRLRVGLTMGLKASGV